MAKRFIESEIWNDPWFMGLKIESKVIWIWLFTQCSNAGIIEINYALASLQTGIGAKSLKQDFFNPSSGPHQDFINCSPTPNEDLKVRLVKIDNAGKYFLPSFIVFQYPKGGKSRFNAAQKAFEEIKSKDLIKYLPEDYKKTFKELKRTSSSPEEDLERTISKGISISISKDKSKGEGKGGVGEKPQPKVFSELLDPDQVRTLLSTESHSLLESVFRSIKIRPWAKSFDLNFDQMETFVDWFINHINGNEKKTMRDAREHFRNWCLKFNEKPDFITVKPKPKQYSQGWQQLQ